MASSPGKYHGVDIKAGTDAEVSKQIRDIDSSRAASESGKSGGDTGKVKEDDVKERYSRIKDTTDESLYKGSSKETKARSVLYDVSDFNEKGRRSALMELAKQKIKVVDQKYDAKIGEERKLGEKDKARGNTISALTGMMGSPEATTRAGGADRRTEGRVAVQNEMRAAEVGAIFSKVDENLMKEKEAHLQSQRENAALLLDEVATNAKSALSRFAGAGISWDQLEATDPDTLDHLIRQSKTDAFTLREMYNKSLPQAQKPEQIFSGWKGNSYVILERDPLTGEISNRTYKGEELGIPKGLNVQTITLGDGVYWYDADEPFGADGKPSLTRVGARPGSGDGGSSTISLGTEDRQKLLSVNLSAQDISDIEKSVNEFGIEATLGALETDAQKEAVRAVYGGSGGGETKLTRENVAKLYGIEDSTTKTGGFLGIGGKTGASRLDEVMTTIGRYQAVGYDDDEILKLIQKGSED